MIAEHINLPNKSTIEIAANEFGSLGYGMLKLKAKAIRWSHP